MIIFIDFIDIATYNYLSIANNEYQFPLVLSLYGQITFTT